MIALALWFLATLDAAFSGYRDAAGRNALINKGRYYRRAMIRGALVGQIAVAIAAVIVFLSLLVTSDRAALMRDYNAAAFRMLLVYAPYAATIMVAFLIRAIPSVDIRSITSTLIFGPFTLIRPFVAVTGVVYGVLFAPRVETLMLGVFVLTMMLSLEKVLTMTGNRRQHSCGTT
jgi:hypothetical protein